MPLRPEFVRWWNSRPDTVDRRINGDVEGVQLHFMDNDFEWFYWLTYGGGQCGKRLQEDEQWKRSQCLMKHERI